MRHRAPTQIIDDLARLSGVTLSPVLQAFTETCDLELRHFMEVGVVLEPKALSIITLGQGQDFGDRVAQLINSWGLDPDPRALIDDLQRSLDTWMLVRVAADSQGRPEVDIYFRKTRPLPETVQWLAQRGVNDAEQQALLDLGRLVGTTRTGILGSSFRIDQPTLFKAYVHIRSENQISLGERLHPCFEHFRIPVDGWRRMLNRIDQLHGSAEADAYASLLLGDGDAFDSLKLDLFHVDLKAFQDLAQASGIVSPNAVSVTDLGHSIGLTCAEHCGFRFNDKGEARLTAYLSSDTEQGIS